MCDMYALVSSLLDKSIVNGSTGMCIHSYIHTKLMWTNLESNMLAYAMTNMKSTGSGYLTRSGGANLESYM